MGKLSAVGECFVNLHKPEGLLRKENDTGSALKESSVTKEFTSELAVADNPSLPIFSRFHLTG